jgi:hypothetical protein
MGMDGYRFTNIGLFHHKQNFILKYSVDAICFSKQNEVGGED